MARAPKGNQNALRRAPFASPNGITEAGESATSGSFRFASGVLREGAGIRGAASGDAAIRRAILAILHLEQVIDEIRVRMKEAEGDEFIRLANSISLAATALFNGHRTIRYLAGAVTPMEEALRELKGLDFRED